MSINKTQLGLNKWTSGEKPLMSEFNSDNLIIDTKIRELDRDLAKKANISTPTENDLLLSAGIIPQSNCKYSKDQFNTVIVNVNVKRADGGTFNNGDILFTLPSGFRPQNLKQFPACGNNGQMVGALINVNADGIARAGLVASGIAIIHCNMVFLAK